MFSFSTYCVPLGLVVIIANGLLLYVDWRIGIHSPTLGTEIFALAGLAILIYGLLVQVLTLWQTGLKISRLEVQVEAIADRLIPVETRHQAKREAHARADRFPYGWAGVRLAA